MTAKIIRPWKIHHMAVLADQIINVESGGNANARNPRSTATGAGQFINSTWLATVAKHRPDLVEGKSPSEILSLRSDPALSRQMTEAYASDNGQILTGAGVPVTPGTTYLAHFAGPQGAVKVLQADPNAPVGDVLGAKAVEANPFLRNMTVSGLVSWADKKMGAPAAPANSPASTLASAPSAQAQTAALPPVFPGTAPASPAAGFAGAQQQPQTADFWSRMPAQASISPDEMPLIRRQKIAALTPRYGKGYY
jgi:hypothetical protein